MGKKVSVNNKKLDAIGDEQARWEDLMLLRDQAVDDLIKGQGLTSAFIKEIQPLLDEHPEIKEASVGLIESYTDIAKQIKNNMASHITLGENNEVLDYKKGEIDPNSDEMLDYINVIGNYIHASEQITSLSAKGHLELLTLVRASGVNLDTEKEEEELADSFIKGTADLEKAAIEGLADAVKEKNKKEGKNGKKSRKRKQQQQQ